MNQEQRVALLALLDAAEIAETLLSELDVTCLARRKLTHAIAQIREAFLEADRRGQETRE